MPGQSDMNFLGLTVWPHSSLAYSKHSVVFFLHEKQIRKKDIL